MLKFLSQAGVEIYAGATGLICFKQLENYPEEEQIVCITIGQFRSCIKNSQQLIEDAEFNRKQHQEELANETNS
jgi:hypothetical protein